MRSCCFKRRTSDNISLVFFVVVFFFTHAALCVPASAPPPADGLHSAPCGLSLWQRQDGQLPAPEPRQAQRQNQGGKAAAGRHLLQYNSLIFASLLIQVYKMSYFVSSLPLFLCFFSVFLSPRTVTLHYTRQRSRATPTSSICCFSTEPRPTSSPWSVPALKNAHTHTHRHAATGSRTQY